MIDGFNHVGEEHVCNVCSCDYSNDEGGIQGHFGMLPVSFCPTCFSSMCDMALQCVEPDLELQEQIESLQDRVITLSHVNQDLKFQLVEKDNKIKELENK
jgi:hypothetical protein